MKGKIIRLLPKQGIGFVRSQYEDEVPFDKYALEGYTFDDFTVGDTVTYNVEEGPKGLRAINIRMSI